MTVYTDLAPDAHDHLVRYVFCRPKAIAMVLRRVLPKALLAVLDLRSIRYAPTVHVNPRLRRREPDLCFTIDALDEGRRITIYLVIEHQSNLDARMPLRALVYAGETWVRYTHNHPRRRRGIPFILSLLLTQHPARNTPTRLSSILDVSPKLRRILGAPFEVDLLVDDFSGSVLGDEKAPAAIRALVEVARAFLHAYENPSSLTPKRMAVLAPLIDALLLKHKRPDDVQALWVYVSSVFEAGSPLLEMITKSISTPAREMYMTIKEDLLAQGQAEGEARGRALALLGMLEHRGVPISASVRKRVLATRDELALQRWIQRSLTVTSTAELFEPPRGGVRSKVVRARASPARAGGRRPAARRTGATA
jgi:predicted transposase YdaD